MKLERTVRSALAAVTAVVTLGGPARAQAWNYPSFQPPRVAVREFNFALAGAGDPGASLVTQWREGVATRSQLSLDLGFASPTIDNYVYADSYFLAGGQFAHQLARADKQMPLDLLLTVGVNAAIGDTDNLVRIPFGVSVGHWFPVEAGMSVTPYAHVRASYDYCSECGPFGSARSQVSPNIDVGFDFTFNPQLATRLSATVASSVFFNRENALGVSLAWSPGMQRPTRGGEPARPRNRSR